MKNTYVAPKTEIVVLSDNDILAVSGLFKNVLTNGSLDGINFDQLMPPNP